MNSGSGMDMMDNDAIFMLALVALVLVGVLAVALVVVTLVLSYCIYRCRKDVEIKMLKRIYGGHDVAMSQLEEGKQKQEIHDYPTEPPAGGRLSPPPDPPPLTTFTAPPPNHHPPKPMKPQPPSYSAVNVLGILPDNLRTPQNLEAGELSEDQQQDLEKYLKERQQYEEPKLKPRESQQSKPKPAATTNSSMKARSSISPPGYEDVPGPRLLDDDYNNPADMISGQFSNPKETSPGKSSPPGGGQKFQIESRMNMGQEEYTEVFDTLPEGKAERIGMPPNIRPRGHSDSSPLVRHFSSDHHSDFGPDSSGAAMTKPNSLPSHSLEDLAGSSMPRNETKRQSTKRDSAKELVEIDQMTKKVRMESQRGKKRKPNGIANNNCNNNYLDNDRDSPDGSVKGAEPAGNTSPVKPKSKHFEISGDGPSDEYAKVNVTDKQQYRTEADITKKEGSGKPQHYSAAQKSPNDFGAESTSV